MFSRFPIRGLVFWVFGLILAGALYNTAREFTTCWRLTSLPGLPSTSCGGERVEPFDALEIVNESDQSVPTPTLQLPVVVDKEYPTWDGGSRINILFVGLRGGDVTEGDCPFCTDTLILLTVDPVTKTGGMLSIPRDMWVNVPGYGYNRINTAWMLGRGSRLPGGGPALTMKTVSHFIGVPVDYYVQVDFNTFIDIIDMLGGVDIYNDETIILDLVSHGQDFPKVKLTCCGMRHLDGRKALAYARCRKESQGCEDGDVGRARRQQKVIFAIRDKILDAANFPSLLARAPQIYSRFSTGIQTNMPFQDAVKLAVLVSDIPEESIRNGVIDHSMASFGNTVLGGQNASVLKPLHDKIRVLRDEIFTTGGAISPWAEGDLLSLAQADDARIRILNGTMTSQLDSRTARYLSQHGLLVTEVSGTSAQSRTTVILYSPTLYTFRYLIELFEIERSTQILIRPDASQTVDIEVRLGSDWDGMLPSD
jgi:polyisoprenyl-teichoic acid--peptidoglycan teichoic acid transferase